MWFVVSYDHCFTAACDAMASSGLAFEWSDPATGWIVAKAPMSFRSWGERVEVVVGAPDSSWAYVTVSSRSIFGLIDWGKNRENVERVVDGITARLGHATRG